MVNLASHMKRFFKYRTFLIYFFIFIFLKNFNESLPSVHEFGVIV